MLILRCLCIRTPNLHLLSFFHLLFPLINYHSTPKGDSSEFFYLFMDLPPPSGHSCRLLSFKCLRAFALPTLNILSSDTAHSFFFLMALYKYNFTSAIIYKMAPITSLFPPLFCFIVFFYGSPFSFSPHYVRISSRWRLCLFLFTAKSHAPGSVWNKSITK